MKNFTRKTAVKVGLIVLAAVSVAALTILLVTTHSPNSPTEATLAANGGNVSVPQEEYGGLEFEHDGNESEIEADGFADDEPESEPAESSNPQSVNPNSNTGNISDNGFECEPVMSRLHEISNSRNSTTDTATPDQPTTIQTGMSGTTVTTPSSWTSESVAKWINDVRAEVNLPALSTHKVITDAAQIRADESRTSFSHTRPCGRGFLSAFNDLGYRQGRGSETIAHATPVSWLSSPGHYKILTSSTVTHVGVGISGSNFVAIFTIGAPSAESSTEIQPPPNAAPPPENTPPPQNTAPPPENVQPPQESVPPEPTPAPVTGFDCPQPYYSCYCTPGNPCSP